MSSNLGDMVVSFGADLSGLQGGIGGAANMLSKFAGSAPGFLGPAGVALAAVGTAAVGIGAMSVKMAGDFQQSMLKVSAYAGLSGQAFDDMKSKVLDMASSVGKSPQELADALYPIVSSGYSSAQALNILKLSAETSAASGAKLSVVADALTTSLKSMHAPASQAGIYMDMINKIVSLGKGEVPQYAAVIGKLSLSAQSAKVPFSDMGAALATLTTHGFPSVAQASTSLSSLFTQMGPKVDAMAQHAQKLGISFNENAFKSMDFAQKLNYLNEITHGNQGEILKLVGGNTLALKAFNSLIGASGDFTNNLNAMKGAAGTTSSVFNTSMTGWNATTARLSATFQVFLVKLGTALLPTLTQLANWATNLIAGFNTWESKTHGVETAMGALGAGMSTVSGLIGGLITNISTIVSFFQQNQVAADLLAGAMAGLAVAIIAANAGAIIAAVTAIPGVVIGFGAWAVAAGAAAIATLMAAAPFILIGVIVALVVAGIILAVQHWGEIAHWLQGVWAAFSSWFTGAMGAVGAFFVGLWNGTVKAVQSAWNFIVNLVKQAVQGIISPITSMVQIVVGLFAWLYNHNYYFQNLINAIMNDWSIVVGATKAAWNSIVAYLRSIWNGIVTAFDAVRNFFASILARIIANTQQGWNTIRSVTMSVWNAIVGFIQGIWNRIWTNTVQGWQTISRIFSGAWNTYIAGPLGGLWNQFAGWFGNLASQALTWGRNLIQGVINGINSMLGAVGNAAGNVAHTIASFLGFHSPAEKGPGRELDIWGPNLAKGFARGIEKGIPMVEASITHLVKPLGNLNYPSSSGSSALVAAASSGGGTTHIHNHLYIDGRELSYAMIDHLGTALVDRIRTEGPVGQVA